MAHSGRACETRPPMVPIVRHARHAGGTAHDSGGTTMDAGSVMSHMQHVTAHVDAARDAIGRFDFADTAAISNRAELALAFGGINGAEHELRLAGAAAGAPSGPFVGMADTLFDTKRSLSRATQDLVHGGAGGTFSQDARAAWSTLDGLSSSLHNAGFVQAEQAASHGRGVGAAALGGLAIGGLVGAWLLSRD